MPRLSHGVNFSTALTFHTRDDGSALPVPRVNVSHPPDSTGLWTVIDRALCQGGKSPHECGQALDGSARTLWRKNRAVYIVAAD
jgi:hypothetical protein